MTTSFTPLPAHREHRLANGLTLLGQQVPGTDIAAFCLLAGAGSASEPDDLGGISGVLEACLPLGARTRDGDDLDARELGTRLDELGAQRGGAVGIETLEASGACLSENLPQVLELHACMLARPLLPSPGWEAKRDLALEELAARRDSPRARLLDQLRRELWLGGHARPVLGTKAGLDAITTARLRDDAARRLEPSGAILGVAGRFDWPELVRAVEESFASWPARGVALPRAQLGALPLSGHLADDKEQQQIVLAWRTPAPGDAWWPAHALAMGVLGGGMGARLFQEVREKRGLVYGVSASAHAHRGVGYALALASTTPERADATLGVLREQIELLALGVSSGELETARTKALAGLCMSASSSPGRAASLARDFFLRGRVRSDDEIADDLRAVTLVDIRALFEAHPPGPFAVATLGPRSLGLPAWSCESGA